MSTNDAQHAGDALTRGDAEHAGDALTKSFDAEHAGDALHEKVLQRFKRCVQVDRDHHRRSVHLMNGGFQGRFVP